MDTPKKNVVGPVSWPERMRIRSSVEQLFGDLLDHAEEAQEEILEMLFGAR